MVRSFIDQSDGELDHLRITTAGSPLAPSFDLTLVTGEERGDDETEVDVGDFTVLVADAHAPRLKGATVDFVERVNESGFEVRPADNGAGTKDTGTPAAGAAGADATGGSEPEGELARRVRELLDTRINPQIAAHGGVITLVDVQDTDVYVEMSGGCQGCAMSRLTLRQGVERMLRQAIPELTGVHDVTDHASGTNPFYQAPA